jgi:CRISPR-associated protein (TIGR03986 family)
MSLSAPYRFVPASKVVLFPNWADQVSHDMPFEDGVCGELSIQLNCDTPLCVGGKQTKLENGSGEVEFFRTPDNHPAIPGSSIKGMLRNVLEIASFARFKQVEEKRLGVRDISDSNNFYCKAVVRTPVQAGWLSFNSDGNWQVQPCDFSRLHQRDLIDYLRISANQWKNSKTAKLRYDLIGICPPINGFDLGPMPAPSKQNKAMPSLKGKYSGRIVVTGQPGDPFDKNQTDENGKEILINNKPVNKNKKYEFVFHDSDKSPIEVSAETMTGFKQIHAESKEWEFWEEKLATRQLDQGIPVFFHTTSTGSIKSMGLAMMYKLPYENSLHDAIRHTLADHLDSKQADHLDSKQPDHLDSKQPDLPDLIFGYLGDDHPGQNRTQWGARGRVNIGLTELAQPAGALRWHGPMILNGPKPTFYPAYIRQDGQGNQVRQLMENNSELAGWKRYPVKALDIQYPSGKAADNPKTQVRLETVPDGSVFNFKIRFHNLRRVELGALLWSLDFGNKPECRHGLGIGKPFGFGQVGLTVTGSKMRANDGSDVCEQKPTQYLKACRVEFDQLMQEFLGASGNQWENAAPIKALRDMARPVSDPALLAELRYFSEPKEFVEWRHSKNLDEVVETFHKAQAVKPSVDYSPGTTTGHLGDLVKNLEKIHEQALVEQEKAARAKAKASATEEDRLMMTIEDLCGAYKGENVTKSAKDNLAKELGNAHKQQEQLSDAQQSEVVSLVSKINEPADSKLGKIIKKILRDFRTDQEKADT